MNHSHEVCEREYQRYLAAMHAMQSGVAMWMNVNGGETSPKHLRVGVNAAMRDHASLVKLLIDKGVITNPEYITAIADGMEEEAQMYEEKLSAHYGRKVTLG